MQADTPLILFSLLVGLFCVVGLVEHSLYGGWNRTYYTHGLPFVILRIPVANTHQETPPLSLFQERFQSALIGSLIFQEIAPNTYGFRRRFFQSSLFPDNLMHGVLLFDRENSCVIVKGFINGLVPLLVLAVGVFSLLVPFQGLVKLMPLAIVGLVIGIPLLMERRRCVKLARFAESAWNTIPEKAASGLSSDWN